MCFGNACVEAAGCVLVCLEVGIVSCVACDARVVVSFGPVALYLVNLCCSSLYNSGMLVVVDVVRVGLRARFDPHGCVLCWLSRHSTAARVVKGFLMVLKRLCSSLRCHHCDSYPIYSTCPRMPLGS